MASKAQNQTSTKADEEKEARHKNEQHELLSQYTHFI